MKGITIENYRDYIGDVYEFCKVLLDERQNDPEQTKLNMSLDWENVSSSFLRKIHDEMFLAISLVYNNSNVVAVSGIEKYDDKIVCILKRLAVIKAFRFKPATSKFILPQQIKWAKENGWKKAWISVNEYNITVVRLIERIKKGKGVVTYHSELFKNFEYIGIKNIQNTEQHTYEYILS